MAQTGITGTGMTCSQQTVLYRASFERNAILFFIACFKTIIEKSHRYYPDLYIPSQKKIIEVKSPYTYNKQLEQNHCKKNQVVQDGYTFEFWICSKEELIERIK
jgi:hypothetical protein